jgi:hypothetical protein
MTPAVDIDKASRSTHRRAASRMVRTGPYGGANGDYSEEEKLAKLPMLTRPAIVDPKGTS